MRDKENILKEENTDIVEKQIMSPIGDTEEGNVSPVKEIGEEEDVETIIELLNKDAKDSFSPKYQEELANMAKEDPTSVMIETPEGWMTIAEAMKKGFNPESGQFDGESIEQRIDRIIKEQGLDADEGARIKQMVLRQEQTGEAPVLPEGELPEGEGTEGEPVPPEAVPEGAPEEAEPQVDPALLDVLGGGN
jgi:hypothetical protein